MNNSVYQINKGINKAIEFKGLKAQYIAYLAIGLLFLLIAFAILFISGIPVFICLPLIGVAGAALFTWVYRYSHKYGTYGLMKEGAYRNTPVVIRCRKQRPFFNQVKK
jgi:cell division protein FtsW (lipid II flippase)